MATNISAALYDPASVVDAMFATKAGVYTQSAGAVTFVIVVVVDTA